MTQKVADQHELLNRWRKIATDLALSLYGHKRPPCDVCDAALRRYEEARNE